MSPKTQICRTCLNIIAPNVEFYSLEDELDTKGREIKSQLESCVPQLTIDIIQHAVVCVYCANALCICFNFQRQCIETEEKIYNCLLLSPKANKCIDISYVYEQQQANSPPTNGSTFTKVEPSDGNVSKEILEETMPDQELDDCNSEIISKIEIKEECLSSGEGDHSLVTELIDEDLWEVENVDVIVPNMGGCLFETTCEVTINEEVEQRSPDGKAVVSSEDINRKVSRQISGYYMEHFHTLENKSTTSIEIIPTCATTCNRIEMKRTPVVSLPGTTTTLTCFTDILQKRLDEFSNESRERHENKISGLSKQTAQARSMIDLRGTRHRSESFVFGARPERNAKLKENLIGRHRMKRKVRSQSAAFTRRKSIETIDFCPESIENRIESDPLVNVEKIVCEKEKVFSSERILRNRSIELFESDWGRKRKVSLNSSLKQVTRTDIDDATESFQCANCSFKTESKCSLLRHIKIQCVKNNDVLDKYKKEAHKNHKPFKCKYCPYRSSLKTNVFRHKLIHTGEKPFKCLKCKFSSCWQQSLQFHINNQHAYP